MVDDYDGEVLRERFASFEHARRILDLEIAQSQPGKINIERIMTRLEGRMPYDTPLGADKEVALLLSELKKVFRQRLENARKEASFSEELKKFGEYCVEGGNSCITFNYDDFLDEALWDGTDGIPEKHWHPDGGYGFFCKPSTDCVRNFDGYKDITSMSLLKLHGSVNWRPRLGWNTPYGVDSIVHHSQWFLARDPNTTIHGSVNLEEIERHLEPDPFIIPPVLAKSAIVREPLLQAVWTQAYNLIAQADEIVFLGYSFPITDIAARVLFGESVRSDVKVKVVNLASGEDKVRITGSYKQVFPTIEDSDFYWTNARDWINTLISQGLPVQPADKVEAS